MFQHITRCHIKSGREGLGFPGELCVCLSLSYSCSGFTCIMLGLHRDGHANVLQAKL